MKYCLLFVALSISISNLSGQSNWLGNNKVINDSIKKHLEGFYERTMNPRWDYFKAIDVFGKDSKEAKRLELKMVENDSILLAETLTIFNHYGWPKLSQVDTIASTWAAIQIVHSDIETQRKFLPIFFKELLNGELFGENWALLIDKLLMLTGQKQIYGTQNVGFVYKDSGRKTILWPVENYDTINDLRRSIGMNSIEESTKLSGSFYDPIVTIEMVKMGHN